MVRDMKQEVDGFGCRFWSKSMPALERFISPSDPDRLDSVTGDADCGTIHAATDAIDRFVAVACVALGLLLMAPAEPADGDVAF